MTRRHVPRIQNWLIRETQGIPNQRTGEHPERHLLGYAGILQAGAYAGFNRLYAPDRQPGPITEAACWSHGRRKFFELADVTAKARGKPVVIAPLALEAVIRIDAIFDVEREINGRSIDDRLAVRRARVAPLVADLEAGPSTQALRFSLVRRPSLCLLRKPARLSVKHHLVN